jgi:SpoVK/Ycf46/Vps4 family AAA+-type ATPase
MEDIYIPERFWRAVVLHIAKNHMVSGRIHSPLILGIHGPSGEGKTFQCEHILQEIGVKSFLISGGQLESHEAGEPARLVRTTYLRAGQSVAKRECDMAVVLINDIDTGLGSWGEMVQ